MQMAAATPIVTQKSAEMKDRRLESIPVSLIPVKVKENILLGGLRERQLKSSDDNESLGESYQNVCWGLYPHMNALWG